MSQLILWNNTKYAQTLAKFFGQQNVIFSQDRFSFALKELKQFDSLVVLCELNWSMTGVTKNLHELYGIELVQELRRDYQVTLPILFVSFHSLNDIFSENRKIVKAIGHDFYQLPEIPERFIAYLKTLSQLSPTELLDIQLYSCDPAGIVNEIIHHIQGLVNKAGSQREGFLQDELEKSIRGIYSAFKESFEISIRNFRNEYPTINQENTNRALRYVEEEGKRLIDKYSPTSNETSFVNGAKRPWKLLLLDDEIGNENDFVKLLTKRGVDVVCTSNADDAMKALTADDQYRGKISLILTDYRLKDIDGKIEIQHKTQGYTFLQNVGKRFQSKLLSAIVYSGMPRQFLLDTYKTFRVRSEIFSKIDFKLSDSGARNFLSNRIIETGEANYKAILALPMSSSGWAEHLHETYLLYRNQPDYEMREREICDYCTDWVEKFRNGQNPKTPMIKGDTFNAGKKESQADKLQRFEAFYKTRRLAQYLNLYFENKKDNDVQDSIIRKLAHFAKPTSYKTPVAKRRFFSQTLGFKREEFPFGATMEELCWFEYDLQIKVLDGYNRYRSGFNECEKKIGDFISGDRKLKSTLKSEAYQIKGENDQVVRFNEETFCPYVFDKTDIGVCFDWLDKQKEHLNEQGERELIELMQDIKKLWI
jgi:CheY-like chemotaxis protein